MSRKTIITPTFKVITLVLILAVLLPSAVKFSHVFTHHKHEVCKNDSNDKTHFHELDVDCEFYKFKLNTNYYSGFNTYKSIIQNTFNKVDIYFYFFLRTHKEETSKLRGPPALA